MNVHEFIGAGTMGAAIGLLLYFWDKQMKRSCKVCGDREHLRRVNDKEFICRDCLEIKFYLFD